MDQLIKQILIRNSRLAILPQDIQDETDLIEELALDSILIVNLFADLEEELAIQIDVKEFKTPVLNQYGYLKQYLLEKTAGRITREETDPTTFT